MSGHEAKAVRAGDGWQRWSAACTCGWKSQAIGKQDAEHRAVIHENVKAAIALVEADIQCDCYECESMEFYGDGPCVRCELRQLLGGVA